MRKVLDRLLDSMVEIGLEVHFWSVVAFDLESDQWSVSWLEKLYNQKL